MKRSLWIGLVLLLLVGCGGQTAPGLERHALVVGDLPQGFYTTVKEHSLRYLQLLIREEARPGLVEAYAAGFDTGPGADTVRSLLFAYGNEMEASAAFNSLQPGAHVQALPALGTEVYLYEPAGSQGETVVTFRNANIVGSLSVQLVSEGLGDPRALATQLAGLILERLRE